MFPVGEQLETMGLMAAYESAIGDLYAACAEVFSEQRALFAELVEAEHRHARVIAAFVTRVRDGAAHLTPDRFRSEQVLAGLDELKVVRNRLLAPEASLPEVLASCVAIEDGLLEQGCFTTIDSDDPALRRVLDCLRRDSADHRDRLRATLDRLRPAV